MRAFSVFLGAALALAGPIAVAPTPNASAAGTGTVLSRSAVPAVNLPSGAVRAVKVLYTTRDQNGRPARSTGVVYYPRGAAPAGGWKVVSWAHGTSGITAKCAPSITSGKRQDEMQPNIAGALARGYVVTATDYIGLGGGGVAEYLGGRSAAYNVIDMIRAARNVDPTIGKRWVSLGHSQGGHAVLFAAQGIVGVTVRADDTELLELLSGIEDADLATLMTRIAADQTSLEAGYTIAGRLSRLSLADYLR